MFLSLPIIALIIVLYSATNVYFCCFVARYHLKFGCKITAFFLIYANKKRKKRQKTPFSLKG